MTHRGCCVPHVNGGLLTMPTDESDDNVRPEDLSPPTETDDSATRVSAPWIFAPPDAADEPETIEFDRLLRARSPAPATSPASGPGLGPASGVVGQPALMSGTAATGTEATGTGSTGTEAGPTQ